MRYLYSYLQISLEFVAGVVKAVLVQGASYAWYHVNPATKSRHATVLIYTQVITCFYWLLRYIMVIHHDQ